MQRLDSTAQVAATITKAAVDGGWLPGTTFVNPAPAIVQARPVIARGYEPREDVLVIQRDTGYIVVPPTTVTAGGMVCADWEDAHDEVKFCIDRLVTRYRGEAGRVFTLAEGDSGFREIHQDDTRRYDEPTRVA